MHADTELLRRFADEGDAEAFAELVRRKIDLVYAAALRQAGGDAHLAQDVTQAVFLALASQARALQRHTVLTGWLYTTTRFAAAKAVRTQARWQRREQEASMISTHVNEPETAWIELRPVLDQAMHELAARDREAILLRYFEGRSLAEVGAAIGLAENSARMRVERALEKLRHLLAQRGITSTAAALGVALANQPVVSAPAGLAAHVAGASLAGAAITTGSGAAAVMGLLYFMQTSKLVLGVIGTIAALGLSAYLGFNFRGSSAPAPRATLAAANDTALASLREENRRLREELARPRQIEQASLPASANLGTAAATLEPMRLLAQLEKKNWVHPEMTFVSQTGTLTESFKVLFNLTPAEQQALQSTVDRARERLAELERLNATVTQRPDGKIEIKVKAFAAEGGQVYNDLMREFANTLGSERDEVYRSLGAEQVEMALSRFGAAERTVTVSRKTPEAANPNAGKLIVVRDETRTRSSSTTNSGDYHDLADVATRIGTLVRLLPPNF